MKKPKASLTFLASCYKNLFVFSDSGDFTAAKEWTIKFRYYRNILEIVKEKTLEIDQ